VKILAHALGVRFDLVLFEGLVLEAFVLLSQILRHRSLILLDILNSCVQSINIILNGNVALVDFLKKSNGL
jgi:hypothetical protein